MNGQSESVESSGDLNHEQALASLVENLESGSLTKTKQLQLAELLKNAPPSLVMTATHHQSFSGPIPPPEQLSNYPDDARQVILAMAKNE